MFLYENRSDSITLNCCLWVINSNSWTSSGARPSGSHVTSLTCLKHLSSASRQARSSTGLRFSFLNWEGGFRKDLSSISFLALFFYPLQIEKKKKKTDIIQHQHLRRAGVWLRTTGWKQSFNDSFIHSARIYWASHMNQVLWIQWLTQQTSLLFLKRFHSGRRGQIINKWAEKIISLWDHLPPPFSSLLLLQVRCTTVTFLPLLKYAKLSPTWRPFPMSFPVAGKLCPQISYSFCLPLLQVSAEMSPVTEASLIFLCKTVFDLFH